MLASFSTSQAPRKMRHITQGLLIFHQLTWKEEESLKIYRNLKEVRNEGSFLKLNGRSQKSIFFLVKLYASLDADPALTGVHSAAR